MNYEEARKHSFNIPWKLDVCHVGEKCWCRLILPTEEIKYTHVYSDTGVETEQEIEWIIPDGSIDKETAEYFVDLHHERLRRDKIISEGMLEAINKRLREDLGESQ